MAEDIRRWAARQGLSGDIVQVLLDQDFTTLDDLKDLSSDDLVDIFQKPQLLKGKQFVALKKAIATLSQDESPPTSPGGRQSSSSYSQSHGRDRPDFVSSELEHLSVDSNAQAQAPRGFFGGLKSRANELKDRVKDHMFGSAEVEEFRLLMLGKTGSGKSTTGNTILGEEKFKSALMFSSVTSECDLQRVEKNGRLIELMDCPGLYDTDKTQEEVSTAIVQAVACMHPGPHAILYVIRVGRYTAEEFGVFNRLKALFDERITDYMIILFTGGDDMDREKATLADMMRHAPKELTQAAKECGHRCHVFNNTASNKKPQVDKLLDEVRRMKKANEDRPYYDCPKYATIGEGLEKEVARRLSEVTKKDLERERYVHELEMKTKEAKEDVEKLKAENERKEAERKRQLEKETRKREQEEERFRQELKAKEHELSEEKRKQKVRELQQELDNHKAKFMFHLDEQREEDRERLEEKVREKERLEERRRQEEREDAERREQAYREEMNRMKEGIANKEEQGWIDWAAGGVAQVVAAPFKAVYNIGAFLFK